MRCKVHSALLSSGLAGKSQTLVPNGTARRSGSGRVCAEVCEECAAAMAQRKGELLKLETLERIASLLTELQQDAVMAQACDDAEDGCPIR